MSESVNRRRFLETTAVASLAATATQVASAAKSANDKIVMAVMGTNGRGRALASGFAKQPGVEIAYICDVDSRAIDKGIKAAESGGAKKTPKGLKDFRHALDDKAVDVLVCAAPNHWHAPATILGCSAGKHVYVEKPCSHNPREGELMVEAARKNNRVVQLGTQRRSSPMVTEAIQKIRDGVIGRVPFSRSWYCNRRPSIGHGKPAPVPSWLDYSLWQGPAPEQSYKNNLIHYNWHWHWHWGCGELGNNGVHSIDVSRWGLGVDYPTRVTAGGGKYRHDDDQETPDTHMVTYDFGDDCSITWEGLSWSPRGFEKTGYGISFHGDKGTLIIAGGKYVILDMHNKELSSQGGSRGDNEHLVDFLDSIRSERHSNADIEEGHKSTLLCHLGNIAHRTGHTLHTDPKNGHILNDPAAQALWARKYRKGWEPQV